MPRAQRAQVSSLQEQNVQLAAEVERVKLQVREREAEVVKSVTALKTLKEARAFSSNQKVVVQLFSRVCVCVCVCVRERERERKRESLSRLVCVRACKYLTYTDLFVVCICGSRFVRPPGLRD